MKLKFFSVLVLCAMVSGQAWGQVRVGIKGGLSSVDIEPSSLIILDAGDAEKFKLDVRDAKYGLHLGFFIQAQLGGFFIQPELVFNSNSVDYAIEDLQNIGVTKIRDENYQYLDIPIIVGAKFGPVRIGAGPVGHLFLDSTSDLFDDYDGYDPNFDELTFGWQAGIGLDIWKLHLDARYEGNLSDFGDHIVFNGRSYAFDKSPTRLIASVGISF
ncbi:MAG: porin family protein [Saprospiraceae bacterium]|nr:porin family protein [Saprospiraceae bacterium]